MVTSLPYFEDELSNEALYRHDLQQLPQCSEEERRALIVHIKAGNQQARSTFALSFASYIASVANKYATICAHHAPRIEFLDLVQLGNLTILERMDKALQHPNPIGYLCKAASFAIVHYCQYHSSLIVTPMKHNSTPMPAMKQESLDAPAYREDAQEQGSMLSEVLQVETRLPESEQERDYTPLYQAVEQLNPGYREIVVHVYGLGCAPEPLVDILNRQRRAEGKTPISGHSSGPKKRYAMQRLRTLLEPMYAPTHEEVSV